jgi:hypothetical protein
LCVREGSDWCAFPSLAGNNPQAKEVRNGPQHGLRD